MVLLTTVSIVRRIDSSFSLVFNRKKLQIIFFLRPRNLLKGPSRKIQNFRSPQETNLFKNFHVANMYAYCMSSSNLFEEMKLLTYCKYVCIYTLYMWVFQIWICWGDTWGFCPFTSFFLSQPGWGLLHGSEQHHLFSLAPCLRRQQSA